MKYTIEMNICYELEDDGTYTDEELQEIAKEFLENLIAGKMTITTEDGRVVEVKK